MILELSFERVDRFLAYFGTRWAAHCCFWASVVVGFPNFEPSITAPGSSCHIFVSGAAAATCSGEWTDLGWTGSFVHLVTASAVAGRVAAALAFAVVFIGCYIDRCSYDLNFRVSCQNLSKNNNQIWKSILGVYTQHNCIFKCHNTEAYKWGMLQFFFKLLGTITYSKYLQ